MPYANRNLVSKRDELVQGYLDAAFRDARKMLSDPLAWGARRLVDSALSAADWELKFGGVRFDTGPIEPRERIEPIKLLAFNSPPQPGPDEAGGAPPRRRRSGMPAEEANLLVRAILKQEPYIRIRLLADRIGCSIGQVSGLPAWKTVQDARRAGRRPREKPTDPLLLDSLIADQTADAAAAARRPRGRVRRTA